MSRVNILKRIKIGERWKLVSIPKTDKGGNDWKALPEGRYYIEWYLNGRRRRAAAGITVAQAQAAQRKKSFELEGRHLGRPGFERAGEEQKKPPLHVAVAQYLELIEVLKKPNTARKYRCVLHRFLRFFATASTVDAVTVDDLNRYLVDLLKTHHMSPNSVRHNLVIVAQFLKRQGRPNMTRGVQQPEPITTLPREYSNRELALFFSACDEAERALFSTFLLTGMREQEVVHLVWSDINFELSSIRVTAKPDLGFYPKRWEEREIPITVQLADQLRNHPRRIDSLFVFTSRTGARYQHMLTRCKDVAARAGLIATSFDLKTFRSTYATRALRFGFDVRTVQHWMGHKSLETTMRYLVPATEVHDRLDQLGIPALPTTESDRKPPRSEVDGRSRKKLVAGS